MEEADPPVTFPSGEDTEAIQSKKVKVSKIAREVNAADSSAGFSTANTLRDHMGLINCDLIDHQGQGLVRLSHTLREFPG